MAKKIKIKKNKKGKLSKKGLFYLFCFIIFMVVSPPTIILLVVSMLPTIVAYFVDQTVDKSKALTIGSFNFAGAFPYLVNLWVQPYPVQQMLEYLIDPTFIIVTYGAAASGYLLYWAVSNISVSMAQNQGKSKVRRIEEKKEKLIQRWGTRVTGSVANIMEDETSEEEKA